MSNPLPGREPLTHETMWRHIRQLLDRALSALEKESVIDECLDIVVDLLGADRGMVFLRLADGGMQAIHARGHKRSLAPEEREEMSRTVVRQALEQDECVVWDPVAAASTSASFAILGIAVALAAPLRTGGAPARGVLYVDFRDRTRPVGERHVEFFMTATALFAALLEQHDRGRGDRDLLDEARSHPLEIRPTPPLEDLLSAPSLSAIRAELRTAVAGDAPILIVGESGCGKTLLAQAIAEASGRRPVVRAVLGSSDDLNTITSELFGHERGAFSGAAGKRMGLVEYASGGTLILDEILNLPVHAQQLLLDFTQFGTYRPLGHDRAEPKRAKVRIIAATNGDLRKAIDERRFREDLYYRLAGVMIDLPPLRARRAEVPTLAEGTLRRVDPGGGWTLSLELRRLLVSPAIDWSGNVRQLEHAVERARERALARDPETRELRPEDLAPRDVDGATIAAGKAPPGGSTLAPDATQQVQSLEALWGHMHAERARVEELEKDLLRRALAENEGVVAHAARALGVARTTLASRLEALGLRAATRGSGR
jgi:transcriptional regulator with GAF, ATPase, and Fis domain